MADRLSIILEAIDKFSPNFAKLDAVLSGSEKLIKKYDAGLRVLEYAFAGVAAASGALIVKTTLTAAQTQVMGTALQIAGKNAGYSAAELASYEKQITGLNITTQGARTIMRDFIVSELDLANASKVARIAQDLAVGTTMNSAQATQALTSAIVNQEVILLRQFGIYTTLPEIYEAYALQLGKTADELTEVERKQAFLNKAFEKGKSRAGTYAASLDDAGKLIYSMQRVTEEASISIGNTFLPLFSVLVKGVYSLGTAYNSLPPAVHTFTGVLLLSVFALSAAGWASMTLIRNGKDLAQAFLFVRAALQAHNITATIAIGTMLKLAATMFILWGAYKVGTQIADSFALASAKLEEQQKKTGHKFTEGERALFILKEAYKATSEDVEAFRQKQTEQAAASMANKLAHDALKNGLDSETEKAKKLAAAYDELKRTWEVTTGRALENEMERREKAHDAEIKAIDAARDKRVESLEKGKDAALKAIDAEEKAHDKVYAAEEKRTDKELKDADKVKDARIEAAEKTKDAALDAIDHEIAAYDDLYDAQLKTLDAETKAQLDAIDTQIEGIRDQKEEEQRAREDAQKAKQLAELRGELAILDAKGVLSDSEKKDKQRLEADIAKIEEEVRREKLDREREDLIESLNEKKEQLRDELETKKTTMREERETFLSEEETKKNAAVAAYETEKIAAIDAYTVIKDQIDSYCAKLKEENTTFKDVKDAEKTKLQEKYEKDIDTANNSAKNAIAKINAEWEAFKTADEDIKKRYDDATKIHADNLEKQYKDLEEFMRARAALLEQPFMPPPAFKAPSNVAAGAAEAISGTAMGGIALQSIPGGGQLAPNAASSFTQLFNLAESMGVNLIPESTYRTFQQQLDIWNSGVRPAVNPNTGTSKHQLGLAIDLPNYLISFMQNFGRLFGWKQPLPATDPGHWEYVGAYQKGGILPATGYYYGHKGEMVLPAQQVAHTNISIANIELPSVTNAREFINELTAQANLLSRSGYK